MGGKPYTGGFNYLQRGRLSTELDYGNGLGKKKKPRQEHDSLAMEHYHHANFDPLLGSGYEIPNRVSVPTEFPKVKSGDVTWGCCDGIQSSGGVVTCDDPEVTKTGEGTANFILLEAITPGLEAEWNLTQLGPSTGNLVDAGVVYDGYNCPIHHAIYFPEPGFSSIRDLVKIVDNNGCEDSIFIDLGAECSEEGAGCEACDCEDTEAGCYEECCGWTESGTPYEISRNDTKQYTCSGGGEWSVSGTGVSIDENGLLSTDGTACGTPVVHNTICGDIQVRVVGAGTGGWFTIDFENFCAGCNGAGCFDFATTCTVIIGTQRIRNNYWCLSSGTCSPGGCSSDGECTPACGSYCHMWRQVAEWRCLS